MQEQDRTELPTLERFGEDLERAMAERRRARRQAPRRSLALAVVVVLLAGALLTPPGRAASGWIGELVGIGDAPTLERPYTGERVDRSVVFATGRAPDGARYEVVLDEIAKPADAPPAKPSQSCLLVEWPDTPGEGRSGSCGLEFPPAAEDTAIGRYYAPPEILKKATKHLVLNGFARSDVSNVKVLYTDDTGNKREAPVDFIAIKGALRERIGAGQPFGFYVAFLPPSFNGFSPGTPASREHGVPACAQHGVRNPQAIELIAYDDRGKEIERVKRYNIVQGAIPIRC